MLGRKQSSKRAEIRAPRRRDATATHNIIGSRLRHYYDDILEQPIPQELTRLLSRLEAKTADEKSH